MYRIPHARSAVFQHALALAYGAFAILANRRPPRGAFAAPLEVCEAKPERYSLALSHVLNSFLAPV